MLDAIYEIETYLSKVSYEEFQNNAMMRVATVKQLEIIGAAAARISSELKQEHPEVPWQGIADWNEILVHEYFGVNYELVWMTARKDIRRLKVLLERILDALLKEDYGE
jgi:uncharacterized protein with HEPN domain